MSEVNSRSHSETKYFTTPRGTKLQLMNLKGKDYLQVAQRIVWFREMHPMGKIETERVSYDKGVVTYRATIFVPIIVKSEVAKDIFTEITTKYEKLANADKTIAVKASTDFEKCETGAIGRALALSGFGTQFAVDDLEEGEHLADAPIERDFRQGTALKDDHPVPDNLKMNYEENIPWDNLAKEPSSKATLPPDPGAEIIKFGKKYVGMPFSVAAKDKGVDGWIKIITSPGSDPLKGQVKKFYEYVQELRRQ